MRTGIAIVLLGFVGVTACQGSDDPSLADKELPAGSCVVYTSNGDSGSGMDAVSCSSNHTHVVLGTADRGACAVGTDVEFPTVFAAGQVYCLGRVAASPSP